MIFVVNSSCEPLNERMKYDEQFSFGVTKDNCGHLMAGPKRPISRIMEEWTSLICPSSELSSANLLSANKKWIFLQVAFAQTENTHQRSAACLL